MRVRFSNFEQSEVGIRFLVMGHRRDPTSLSRRKLDTSDSCITLGLSVLDSFASLLWRNLNSFTRLQKPQC